MSQEFSQFVIIVSLTIVTLIGFSIWRNRTRAESDRKRNTPPNIVLVLADDLGYSDLSVYGGEISTPNINALAKAGIIFTNFHAAPACSPSRAMIMSGVDNHQAGLGSMSEYLAPNQVGKPGYEGYLNDRVVTLPTLLKDGGYHTYMAGKWHLGAKTGYQPADRGFEQSFALLEGGANHFNDMGYSPARPKAHYSSNGQPVGLTPNFYSTNFYTDKLIEFINQNCLDGKPFFVYAAYTSPHEPMQVPQEYIHKYLDKYDMGWDQLRQERFTRMKKLGIIPANVELPPRWPGVPAWDSLTEEQQRYESKKMAIYAGMVENLDNNIGRLLDHLKKIGEYDNTIFVFLSDNGPEGNTRIQSQRYQQWFKEEKIDNSYQNIGNANSFVGVGRAWVQVLATPFLWYKGRVSEGGIRVPAIISYSGVTKAGTQTNAFASVLDLMPTFLEYAGIQHPGNCYQGHPIFEMQGLSLCSLLSGRSDALRQDPNCLGIYGENHPIGFELFGSGNMALCQGEWKIIKLKPPFGDEQWKLFNITQDPTESHDLSKQEPQRLASMISLYEQYEKEKGVISTDEELYDTYYNDDK